MKIKSFSVMFVPHHGGKQRTISLSKKNIQIIGGIGAFLFLLLVVFLVDYFTMNVTRKKYKNLLTENRTQKQMLTSYRTDIDKLGAELTDMEQYVKKLNVMAGLKASEPLREVGGLGDGPGSSQAASPPAVLQDFTSGKIQSIENKAEQIGKNLNTLLVYYQAETSRLASTPSIWPTRGYLSASFGYRPDPFTGKRKMHWGIDIATNVGNPVWATADGRVITCKYDKISGRTIKVAHMGGVTTVYCHLSKYKVKPGQKVKRGQVIGLIGKTGKATGPHLHYEVRVNGVKKNPYFWILEE